MKNGNENNDMKDKKIIKANQKKNRTINWNNLNEEIEIEKCYKKNNIERDSDNNNQIIKEETKMNKKVKHNYKSCLFCCFTVKDDSFPDE